MNKIIKNKKIISDLGFNTVGFGIYIVTQQLVLMPIMAKILNKLEFSKLTIYISLFAIVTNVLGSELGIVRQIDEKNRDNVSDYNRILVELIPFIVFISFVGLFYLDFNICEIFVLTACILLGNMRLYCAACFRLKKCFYKVVIQNSIYFCGILLGVFFTMKVRYIFLPFLLSETFCFVYDVFNTDFEINNIKKTSGNIKIWKKFRDFGFISLLVNLTAYFDKILIYPILGAGSVSVYYATSSMSKVISLVTNPLHGVIISWLRGNDVQFKNKIVRTMLKISIPLILFVFIISLPITYITIRIFYSQYLEQSLILIIPVCVGVAFGTMSSITKGILLKYTQSRNLMFSYLVYIVILVISGIVLSSLFGILGFAISTMIANIVLSICFFILLKQVIRYD